MGPLLMTGLSCFGAAVGLGLIATGTWPSDGAPVSRSVPNQRGLAVILMAFCQGVGVLGVVVGLLAIFVAGSMADPAYGLLAAGPAVVGGLIGLALVIRHWRSGNPEISSLVALFIVGIVVLGIVVAMLTVLIVPEPTKILSDWPFVVLGLINGSAALAIGATGAGGVAALRGVDELTARTIGNAQVSRCLPFQIAYIGASAAAVLLIVLG